jgi:hypothetical protein
MAPAEGTKAPWEAGPTGQVRPAVGPFLPGPASSQLSVCRAFPLRTCGGLALLLSVFLPRARLLGTGKWQLKVSFTPDVTSLLSRRVCGSRGN